MTISIVSPALDTVHLVGPAEFNPQPDIERVSETPEPFPTIWDINFVPCDSVTVPDQGMIKYGLTSKYGLSVTYDGSYYPNIGWKI